jgi:predicted type IV restriction endonuclease
LENIDYYRSAEAKEATVRTEFINPLLWQLGWDVENRNGQSPLERDVKEELSMKVDGVSRAPDYGFLIEGQRKWFLEAKKPSIRLASGSAAAEAAFQLRRYSWSAGLSAGIVTNFYEFAIYDTNQMPSRGDSAAVSRISYFTLDDLEGNWDLLRELFARDSVANGSIEKFVDSKSKRGSQTVDAEFLKQIREWRKEIAEDIASSNKLLNQEDLSLVVQRLLDRIVFLRFAEAMGLEHFGQLRELATKSDIYPNLWRVFYRANEKYNSGLFHQSEISATHEVETGAPSLRVGDEVLRNILVRLYFPYPYEFSVIPVDILGNVYEQFLGDEIQIKDDRSIEITQKEEVRKAGGVYYTPQAVVDFIISETIDPIVDGKTPDTLAKLRFLDPSSGSGSFLIALFQKLISWHENYYNSRPSLSKKFLERGADGTPRLKTSERKKILLNNIFGVDLDPQAVEVTKLSLLLKVLENQAQLEFAFGHILPNLSENIVCGNTLIDAPQDTENQLDVFRPIPEESFFKNVFDDGGFHAIVGNPPYLNVDSVWGAKDPRLAHLKKRYPHIHTDKTDLLYYFLGRAVELSQGEIGFIVSRSFLEADKATKLRGWLSENVRIRRILDLRNAYVFRGVGINTAIVFFTKSMAPKLAEIDRFTLPQLPPGYNNSYLSTGPDFEKLVVNQKEFSSTSWNFGSKADNKIIDLIDSMGVPLGDTFTVGKGMETGSNNAFSMQITDPSVITNLSQRGLIKERARNSDIDGYTIQNSGKWMIYPHAVDKFADLPPEMQTALKENRHLLEKRAAFMRGDCEWWRYSFPLHFEYFQAPKIVTPYMSTNNSFSYDLEAEFFFSTDTTVLYGPPELTEEQARFLVGILNTQLYSARYKYLSKLKGGGQFEYFAKQVSRLPVPPYVARGEFESFVASKVEEIQNCKTAIETSLLESEKRELKETIQELKRVIEVATLDHFEITPKDAEIFKSSEVGEV